MSTEIHTHPHRNFGLYGVAICRLDASQNPAIRSTRRLPKQPPGG